MGLNGMYPQVLKKLSNVTVKLVVVDRWSIMETREKSLMTEGKTVSLLSSRSTGWSASDQTLGRG